MAPIRFSGFELQPHARQLLANGTAAPLGARAFDVLLCLAERAGQLVTKNELIDLVWPNVVVAENNLTVQISSLRKVLGPQVIATIPGRGYRFTATVESTSGDDPPASTAGAASDRGAPAASALSLLPLIGREDELITLHALTREHRWVSVVGAGGIGKTHLVRHLLRLQQQNGSEGRFVDLSGAHPSDLPSLPRLIASALGVQLGPGDPSRSLADALFARPVLLVLDNAEQVADGVARLAEALIDGAPRLHLVVTSQVPLGAAAERVFRLGGLALPEGDADLAQALAHSAIAFFVDRARAADGRFTLSEDNAGLVVDVCRQLDGMALAIELAAARVPTLGLRGLSAALEQRFRLLTSGRRFAPARQQTLHAALDWSHGLLAASEQAVFRRLGIFIGSFALESAQAVAADDGLDEWAVLDALTGLVDRSLVAPTEQDPPRYRLLDTPRAYAQERLRESDEAQGVARRHALAFRDRFWQADEDWLAGRVKVDAFRHTAQPDLADGRAALAWAVQHDRAAALALAVCLDWAMANEPSAVRRALWDSTEPLLDESLPASLRARWWAGWYSWATLFVGPALGEKQARALDEGRRLGDRRALYWMLRCRLWALTIAPPSDHSVAEESHRCVAEMRDLEDPSWPPSVRYQRMRGESEHCHNVGDWSGSIIWLQRAVLLAAEAGDSRARYSAMVALVDAELALERYEDAARDASALIDALRSSPFESTLVLARQNLVLASVHRRDFAAARSVSADAWPLSIRFGLVGLLSNNLALLAALEGRPADAARLVGYADHKNQVRGGDRQINEARAAREAERVAIEALGSLQVARLMAEGALLGEAGVRELGLERAPLPPAA